MKGLRISAVAVSVLALCLAGPTAKAKEKGKDKTPGSITVAFGTGNNNSAPGTTANHHILPPEFKVRITKARKLDLDRTEVVVPATVNFVVAGFHYVWVYQPGVKVQDVLNNIPAGNPLFIDFEVIDPLGVSNVFAKGIFPGTPPAFADIAPANPTRSAAQNRTDTIAFDKPGRYLIICNVRPHFLDGMYAWVRVVDDDDDN